MNVLFSVIVANYNNNEFLVDLVKSLLTQTYTNWECIIVDDCSVKDALDIAEFKILLDTNDRIKFYRNSVNLGAAATFHRAATLVKGDIIGMLGADDALEPDAIERMVRMHSENIHAALISSNAFWCDEKLNKIEKYSYYKPLATGGQLLDGITIGSFATFKKVYYDKTSGFNSEFKKALDHDLFLKLEEVGDVMFLDEPLYLYRRNERGISQGTDSVLAAHYSNLAKYYACKRRRGTEKYSLNSHELYQLRKKWLLNDLYYTSRSRLHYSVFHSLRNILMEQPYLFFSRTLYAHLLYWLFKFERS